MGVAKYSLLLMVKAVLVLLSGARLVQSIAHYFPCRSAGGRNKDGQKSCKQTPVTLVEGEGGACNKTVGPIDPYTSIDE